MQVNCLFRNDQKKATNGRRRKLLRSFTLASIPTTFERTNRMFQLAKAPLKVKFLVSPKGIYKHALFQTIWLCKFIGFR